MSALKTIASFTWDDPLLLDQQLTDDERMVRDAAKAYCQDKLQPRVLEAFLDEKTDPAIFHEMGELDMLGPTIREQYDGSLCHPAHRVDYSIRTDRIESILRQSYACSFLVYKSGALLSDS
jgi:alkylation response protein AidB-like acyl-CoA dehydrogenase